MSLQDKTESLETAVSWIQTWKRNLQNDLKEGVDINSITKAHLIPTADLMNLLLELEVLKPVPNATNQYRLNEKNEASEYVRGYLANNGTEDKILLVATKQEGTGKESFKDIISGLIDNDPAKPANLVNNGTSGIYDFSHPCPPYCDPNSPLNNAN